MSVNACKFSFKMRGCAQVLNSSIRIKKVARFRICKNLADFYFKAITACALYFHSNIV